MALQGWDKNYREQLKIQEQEIEQTQAENAQLKLMISGGNPGGIPNRPWDDPSKEKGPFVPPPPREKLMIAHGEGRGPQPQYHDEYNRELPIPPWMQMDPSGKLIEIPWMKEQYMREHPELFAGATSRQIRDRLKPFTHGKGYDKDGGSMQGVPDALRIQLLRDAMA